MSSVMTDGREPLYFRFHLFARAAARTRVAHVGSAPWPAQVPSVVTVAWCSDVAPLSPLYDPAHASCAETLPRCPALQSPSSARSRRTMSTRSTAPPRRPWMVGERRLHEAGSDSCPSGQSKGCSDEDQDSNERVYSTPPLPFMQPRAPPGDRYPSPPLVLGLRHLHGPAVIPGIHLVRRRHLRGCGVQLGLQAVPAQHVLVVQEADRCRDRQGRARARRAL